MPNTTFDVVPLASEALSNVTGGYRRPSPDTSAAEASTRGAIAEAMRAPQTPVRSTYLMDQMKCRMDPNQCSRTPEAPR
jgi:hypothetical protein